MSNIVTPKHPTLTPIEENPDSIIQAMLSIKVNDSPVYMSIRGLYYNSIAIMPGGALTNTILGSEDMVNAEFIDNNIGASLLTIQDENTKSSIQDIDNSTLEQLRADVRSRKVSEEFVNYNFSARIEIPYTDATNAVLNNILDAETKDIEPELMQIIDGLQRYHVVYIYKHADKNQYLMLLDNLRTDSTISLSDFAKLFSQDVVEIQVSHKRYVIAFANTIEDIYSVLAMQIRNRDWWPRSDIVAMLAADFEDEDEDFENEVEDEDDDDDDEESSDD